MGVKVQYRMGKKAGHKHTRGHARSVVGFPFNRTKTKLSCPVCPVLLSNAPACLEAQGMGRKAVGIVKVQGRHTRVGKGK